jgi:Holliday junction resolvasome RuvABC endonuclease subunit
MIRLRREDEQRVLAIDPTSKGFGFAVLEGPVFLADWGNKDAGRADSILALRHLGGLLDHYRPDVVVVEDVTKEGSRRRARVREMIGSIESIAAGRGILLARVSRHQVRVAFGGPCVTKQQIATAIADHFPELVPRLPPRRKAWMSEDERMAIFDAVSFALTFYYFSESISSHESQQEDQTQPAPTRACD